MLTLKNITQRAILSTETIRYNYKYGGLIDFEPINMILDIREEKNVKKFLKELNKLMTDSTAKNVTINGREFVRAFISRYDTREENWNLIDLTITFDYVETNGLDLLGGLVLRADKQVEGLITGGYKEFDFPRLNPNFEPRKTLF